MGAEPARPCFFSRFRMNKRLDQNAIREVLAFLFRHWRREKLLVVWVSLCMIVATAADLLMPVYSGRLVDAVAMHATARSLALQGAGRAIAMMALLGVVLAVQRYIALAGIIRLALRLMTRFAGEAFWRVQRFSTDWQANNFAGAIVQRITRGMWAVGTMDDILLLEMLPALLVLVGSSMLLGLRWPGMGVTVAIGAVAYTAAAVSLSLYYVAPAARLSNAQDTRIGAAMADAISCNQVVKSFGAERREDYRLAKVVEKWRHRTSRTWTRATRNGTLQTVLLQGLRTLGGITTDKRAQYPVINASRLRVRAPRRESSRSGPSLRKAYAGNSENGHEPSCHIVRCAPGDGGVRGNRGNLESIT